MNKIEFVKVEFKNFLSYGNIWQSLHFHHGINIIQGIDVNTGRSNGSGKTSVLEPISFALFGQTIKTIKKADIPNRYNSTGCMVKLTLKIGDDQFVFHRGIKPNKFDVYKNDDKLAKLSSVKLFQSFIEEEILGIDFKTFKNLIHFSPNNTISIINAKKDQKRQFLESLFDLGIFSLLNKKSNEKLSNNKTSLLMMNKDIETNNTIIQSIRDDLRGFIIPNTKQYKIDLNLLKIKRDGLKEPKYDKADHQKCIATKEEHEKTKTALNDKLKIVNDDIIYTNAQLSNMDFSKIKEEHQKIKEKIDSFDVPKLESYKLVENDILITAQEKIKKSKNDIDVCIQEKSDVNADLTHQILEHERILKELNDISHSDRMTDKVECPNCKQKVDHKLISKWIIEKTKELNKLLKDKVYKINNNNLLLDGFNVKISELKKYQNENEQNLEDARNSLTNINNKMLEHDNLVKEWHNLPDIESLENKYNEDKVKIDKLIKDKKKLDWNIDMLDTEIELVQNSISTHEQINQEFILYTQKIDKLNIKIESLEKQIQEFDDIIKKQKVQYKNKKDEIDTLLNKNTINQKKIKGLQTVQDYLIYIKSSLGDDAIKQYAISSMIPYLNKRANYYLSESGIPYILKLDGWLDVTIIGLGAGEIPYGSLSGGEIKSIDMSIQLACNDLAELQSKSLLNISILDEILDTSLDDQGVMLLMGIISARQKLNNSCTYIITHRRELTDIEYDNIIDIVKEDGFSFIKEK